MENKKSKTSKFKEWINELFKDDVKTFSAPAADGSEVSISDDDADGVASVGDSVTDANGPVISATIPMQDGSTVNTDETGKITSITPKAEEPIAEAEPVKSMDEQLAEMKSLYEAEKSGREEDNKLAQRAIESLNKKAKDATDQLAKIKSEYKPVVSGTQFKQESKESLSDFEKRIAEAKKN